MNCPKCGGLTYDNRAENDGRLAKGEKMRPDFKCKKKECDGVVWRPKEGWGAAAPVAVAAPAPAAAPTAPVKQAFTSGGPIAGLDDALPTEKLDRLFAVYSIIEDHILATSVGKFNKADVGTTPESVAAQIATLLIAAQKAGV